MLHNLFEFDIMARIEDIPHVKRRYGVLFNLRFQVFNLRFYEFVVCHHLFFIKITICQAKSKRQSHVALAAVECSAPALSIAVEIREHSGELAPERFSHKVTEIHH